MIKISKSPTADTRTCDWSKVSEEQLLASSVQHINDVRAAIAFFIDKLCATSAAHDRTKISQLNWFHRDFQTGFKETGWWDNHRREERHHLGKPDGVRDDVNLVDVLEYISDCIMAGMARSGSVYDIDIDKDVLMRAFKNTCELLKKEVVVE